MRHENQLPAKENTQGRHYTPKSPSRAAQPIDPTRITSCEFAKISLQLRKLG
jgi:hypothetical protein